MSKDTATARHALQMAELAAETARRYFRGRLGVEFKADERPVTPADKAVESAVRAYLGEHFPGHGIFGEEHGIAQGDGRHIWIIDPIDGTRSFLSGHPLFGFLLGHIADGAAQLGLVAMPALQETYLGIPGSGAWCGDAPIRSSEQQELDHAILYVNEGDKLHRDHPQVFGRLMQAGQTRRFAYDCYPYALLASGHVDAVVDYDLQPYDYLPVEALVSAAGGVMTGWQGEALERQSNAPVIAAATPQLHRQLMALVSGG
jgi:histidinol phosphatase-like enzyme (inositol monophosphatase family)